MGVRRASHEVCACCTTAASRRGRAPSSPPAGAVAQSKNAAPTRLYRLIRDARAALEDLSGLALPSGAQVGNTNAVRRRPAPEPRGAELRMRLDGSPGDLLFPDRDDEAWAPARVVELEPVLRATPVTVRTHVDAESPSDDRAGTVTAAVDDLGMPRRGYAHPTVTWTTPEGAAWPSRRAVDEEGEAASAQRREDEIPSLSDLSLPSVVTFGRFVSGW